MWNLAVEQGSHWRPHRKSAPRFAEQCRQLTEARADNAWLAAGSHTVQQQALRDFAQAMSAFFAGTHRRPTWRKLGRDEGFRIVGGQAQKVRRLSRRLGEVWIPKVGWVRFAWSRQVPAAKSYRVTKDRAGRWHIAFAAVPEPIPAPATDAVVGVDRGVVTSATLSTGELFVAPGLGPKEAERLLRLKRRLARSEPGSKRRARLTSQIARLAARQTDRRKDFVEKATTYLARSFDVIAIEDLNIKNMTRSARGTVQVPGTRVRQKAGLNRGILNSGWGDLARRLEDKAPGRIVKVRAAYTSQTCSACGRVDPDSRKSQAEFACTVCGHTEHADVNAAKNIIDRALGRGFAAGRAVTARGGGPMGTPANREPTCRPATRTKASRAVIPALSGGEDVKVQ
ncbi:RNA-guided endonuclease TnpB family protein [Catenulispora subtropica]|uniref:RNA-guided endonuclease TnpB family protein n=1 Tax=Catenulispora subtropica TaxID=450798 RepID=A0ABN2T232_9ACTN